MARDLYEFTITTPAGVPVAQPLITALPLPARPVQTVELRIPPGPRGMLGIALGAAGQAVIPYGAGQWIIGDDDHLHWEIESGIESGAWQCFSYNTGSFAHSVYLRFFMLPLVVIQAAPTVQPVPNLSGIVDISLFQQPPLRGTSGPVG